MLLFAWKHQLHTDMLQWFKNGVKQHFYQLCYNGVAREVLGCPSHPTPTPLKELFEVNNNNKTLLKDIFDW